MFGAGRVEDPVFGKSFAETRANSVDSMFPIIVDIVGWRDRILRG